MVKKKKYPKNVFLGVRLSSRHLTPQGSGKRVHTASGTDHGPSEKRRVIPPGFEPAVKCPKTDFPTAPGRREQLREHTQVRAGGVTTHSRRGPAASRPLSKLIYTHKSSP